MPELPDLTVYLEELHRAALESNTSEIIFDVRALEFMSALTNGEEAAVRIGRDEADELPFEIVDLDYGRTIKCHYSLRWSAGDVPAS